MNAPRNVMILASAGSGKTYALTNRFVALLAAGARPERIVALTFTRKAAGEFFDEILRKLARAAGDEAEARRLAEDIGFSSFRTQEFLGLLRSMIDSMHRLRLGTLDSFFARIARAFPMELGLAGEFELLQEHAARVERQRVLRRMFARTGAGPDAAQSEFIEAFKRATFGTEEKRLGARLDSFLDEFQDNYLSAPDAAQWGDPKRIWPNGSSWLGGEAKLAQAASSLRIALGTLTDGQRLRWENFFAALAEWTPGAPLPGPVEYIVKNTLAVWSELCRDRADIVVDRRKLQLSAEACRALGAIVRQIVGGELRRRIETTRGIHAVLRSYEANYHDAVRRAGRLTFADVQRLLIPVTLTGRNGGDGAGLDEAGEAAVRVEENRLFLDYRLDSEIDHWLLDEFQDTSFGQWSVLRNLIDEAVQDPEGRRSFFCVGDVKQAIYAWREGDPRLFREIFNHYNSASEGSIAEAHLVASWRSGPPLIEMVNAVFGNATALSELFPGEASALWNKEWRRHESAVPNRTGHAALLHAQDEIERWEVTRRLLEEIRPTERGLSCAILVRKNDTAAGLAEALRGVGIAALAESDLHIATDNPLGTTLLALVQAASHPGDTLAREHLLMTPLAGVLDEEGLGSAEALTRFVLTQIHAAGFERAMEYWIQRLEPKLARDDAFSRMRAREFIAAAGLFDATGSRNPGEFIEFMERHSVRPPAGTSVVRVMTVHKSKGLGFDVVILPDLQGNRIDERRDGLAVRKAADRSIEWMLDLPPKLFCSQDEVLALYLRSAEADACYESLSLLYVALTRAKRAMYVITEPVGDSKSRNFPRLLAATLGEEAHDLQVGASVFQSPWSSGDPDWHVAIGEGGAAGASPALRVLEPLANAAVAAVPRHPGRRPSAGRGRAVAASGLFSLDTANAAEFGTALHARLAEVEWALPAEAAAWETRWLERGETEAVATAAALCLGATALARVWRKPEGPSLVWREKPFEIVLDGIWITGVFDRVVVERGPDGRAIRAAVFDFKTDRATNDAEVAEASGRYFEQLNAYRQAVAVLTGLASDAVECQLVFTRMARCVEVPASKTGT